MEGLTSKRQWKCGCTNSLSPSFSVTSRKRMPPITFSFQNLRRLIRSTPPTIIFTVSGRSSTVQSRTVSVKNNHLPISNSGFWFSSWWILRRCFFALRFGFQFKKVIKGHTGKCWNAHNLSPKTIWMSHIFICQYRRHKSFFGKFLAERLYFLSESEPSWMFLYAEKFYIYK